MSDNCSLSTSCCRSSVLLRSVGGLQHRRECLSPRQRCTGFARVQTSAKQRHAAA